MIGDRRIRNWKEGRLPGPSRGLPTASQLSALEIEPHTQRCSIYISDRRDFYHQFQITSQRACTNALWPLLRTDDVKELEAFKTYLASSQKVRYDRTKHGDAFGGRQRPGEPLPNEPLIQACFGSIPQGDHLGVEYATASHRGLLQNRGLLCPAEELRADSVWRGREVVQGLVVDDFYAISVENAPLRDKASPSPSSPSAASRRMAKALRAYEEENILGSADKDVVDEAKAKVTGGELDTSLSIRRLGLALLGCPVKKRLALSFLSLELARLPMTTDALHACLVGGWTSCLMYRRPFMSVLAKSYSLCPSSEINQDDPKIVNLPRSVAEELTLLAVLAPLITTDLSASFDPNLYASDESEAKGAYVFKHIGPEASRALWRNGRKKGGYVRMLNREEALIRKVDEMKEEHLFPLGIAVDEETKVSPEKPRAQKFHFIEVCGGAGKVSKFLASKGWSVGPNLDLDGSPFFNLKNLKMLSWLVHLLENELLDSFMVEPPCTTFSPAQYPPSRTYQQPRGLDPEDPKTKEGTELALRALSLILFAASLNVPAILEQPRRSKMRKLSEWLFLIASGLAYETWLASCQYGSPHQKEFVLLSTFPETAGLHRRCTKDHSHVKIEGVWTKASAVYTDQLAEALAGSFDKALSRRHRETRAHDKKAAGLENIAVNDYLLSGGWFTKKVWSWKKPAHINILESAAVGRLFKDLALCKPKTRFSVILDSNVSLSAHVKGRSPSFGLRPSLRRSGATIIGGCLYPSETIPCLMLAGQ